MENRIVFAHMMKTAGTSLSKQLISHFGKRMHIVPGGQKMDDDYYSSSDFTSDLQELDYNLHLVAGHPMRPYIDFGNHENNLEWFTFFRKPSERYISHYLHDYMWSDKFRKKRYQNMNNSDITEWEKIENYSNYQTKFIAGEENYDKAVEIIETKFKWVGLTEKYELGLYSLKHFFDLPNFHFEVINTNKNMAKKEMKENVRDNFGDFIHDNNRIDDRLYNYIYENVWPKFELGKKKINEIKKSKPKSIIKRMVNDFQFHLNRQLKFKTRKLNLKNINRFYNRWYR